MSGEKKVEKAKPKTAKYKLIRGKYIDEKGKVHKPGATLTLEVGYAEGRDRWERVN